MKEASDISALTISLVGVLGVFLILFLLSELVGLLSKFLSREEPESTMVNPSFAELPYFKQRDQIDLVIIAAIMKKRGHLGALSIKRVN